MGDVYLKLGRTDEALKSYQDSLEINQRLSQADPSDSQKQRDISVSLHSLGDVYLKLGRTDEALKSFRDGFEINRTLYKADPSDRQKQSDLSISFNRLGDVYLALGRTDDALRSFQDDLEISQRQCEADSSNHDCRRRLAFAHFNVATASIAQQNFIEAIKLIETGIQELQTIESNESVDHYNIACGYGICLKLVSGWDGKSKFPQEAGLPETTASEKKELIRFQKLSIESLKKATALGYDDCQHALQDSDLEALHNTAEFESIFEPNRNVEPSSGSASKKDDQR